MDASVFNQQHEPTGRTMKNKEFEFFSLSCGSIPLDQAIHLKLFIYDQSPVQLGRWTDLGLSLQPGGSVRWCLISPINTVASGTAAAAAAAAAAPGTERDSRRGLTPSMAGWEGGPGWSFHGLRPRTYVPSPCTHCLWPSPSESQEKKEAPRPASDPCLCFADRRQHCHAWQALPAKWTVNAHVALPMLLPLDRKARSSS